jgi:hypothetical protein
MNANALAKLYDRLTPWERVPLWLAADARGDGLEKERLATSAPRKLIRVADSYSLLVALHRLASHYMMVQLHLACAYQTAVGADLAGLAENDGTLRMVAYDLTSSADLWQRFCAELGFDAELLLKDLPGFATLKATVEAARPDAFTEEEAAAILGRLHEAAEQAAGRAPGGNRVYRMRAVEDQLKEMRETLEQLAAM